MEPVRLSRRRYRRLPALIILMTLIAVTVGALVLFYVEERLVVTTGERLALAAADIADKLDRVLFERYGDIQMMAKAFTDKSDNSEAMTDYLVWMKKAYPVYHWLGVTDARGRIVAATDGASVGEDRSGALWFRSARGGAGVYVQDVQVSEDSGRALVVVFSSPIRGRQGEFLGVVMAQVGLPVLEDVFVRTVRAFQSQQSHTGRIEWQFLTRDGEVIVDSILREAGKVNLKLLALPSALLSASALPGYVEEMHLRRHLPVITGYAQAEGYGEFTGLHWGVLVRMDRRDILAPIWAILRKLSAGAAVIFVPTLGFLLWTTGQLRTEFARGTAAEATLLLRDRAISAISDGIIITDPHQPDAPVVYANPAFERLTGYCPDEVLGRNCCFLHGPGTDPAAVAALQQAFAEERACQVDIQNYRKDGTAFWTNWAVSPVYDATGRVSHFVEVLVDITERRKLEAQLRQAQKMEAIGRLAGGVAHDFNNILTVIWGYSNLLLMRLSSSDPMRKSVEGIAYAGERAADLTRQLLAFSRQQVIQPNVLDLNTVIADMQKMIQRMIGEDIELITALGPELGRIRADRSQIEQVLMNLAVNARDAMPQSGTVIIETANVEFDEHFASLHPGARPGSYVMVAVSDTGIGMDEDTRAHLFEPFFTTKEQGKGTGMGLATVYGIVKQSEGFIWVYSEPGKGTTFKIYLPQVSAPLAPTSAKGPAAQLSYGAETILVVEDEDAVRALMQGILVSLGYTVLEARGGDEALGIADRHSEPIHLLLTDVIMPKLSGPEVAERLAGRCPAMKVLYISGYTDRTIGHRGILKEGVAYIQKPFTPFTLSHKVREVLDEPTGERSGMAT